MEILGWEFTATSSSEKPRKETRLRKLQAAAKQISTEATAAVFLELDLIGIFASKEQHENSAEDFPLWTALSLYSPLVLATNLLLSRNNAALGGEHPRSDAQVNILPT